LTRCHFCLISNDMVHLLPSKAGHYIIGLSGTFSLLACVCLLGYFAFIFGMAHLQKTLTHGQSRAHRFMTSQSGALLMNLIVADTIQAFGFSLSSYWAYGDRSDFALAHVPRICTFQAICIQVGDVGAALFTLAIALHTVGILMFNYRPSGRTVGLFTAAAWIFNFFITGIGPLWIQDSRPFYCGSGESFCWISINFEHWRLPLHFIFLIITACFIFPLYISIFVAIRYRQRPERVISDDSHASSQQSGLSQRMDQVATRMLYFPIAYFATVVLLTIYRLATLAGHTWDWRLLIAASTIYATNGLFDVVLYCWTRGLVSLPSVVRGSSASRSLSHSISGRGVDLKLGLTSNRNILKSPFSSPADNIFSVPDLSPEMSADEDISQRSSWKVDAM